MQAFAPLLQIINQQPNHWIQFRELAPIVNCVDGFEFVWITDGEGWNSAKSKLAEAYNEIPRMYNFTTLPEFLNEIKSEM